jgi:hypothetical protein
MGVNALLSNTTGSSNVAIGATALDANTTASGNTAIGRSSLGNNTTGPNNTAVGCTALLTNTTGSDNTSVGYCSMYLNTTGYNHAVVGKDALRQSTTGANSAVVGHSAGRNTTTGGASVLVGYRAGCNITTGVFNTMVGYLTESAGVDVCYQIVVAARATTSTGKGVNTGYIDPNGGGVFQGNNSTAWSQTSDRRIKKNIVDNTTGLDKINQIKVRNFEYRTLDEITDFGEFKKSAVVNKEGIQLGAIAQELEEVLPEIVKTESTGVKTVDPTNLTWYMVNAIKELKAEIELLKNK